MQAEEIAKIWWEEFPDLPRRRFAFAYNKALDELWLSEAQARYLIREYKKDIVFPNIGQFISWTEERLRNEEVPEDLVCRARLSGNPTLIEMADDITTLAGAWYPDEQSNRELDSLRNSLRAVLNE